MFAFFLTSGLFLGWSLGANDAANVFGTAVGTRMISFKKAAIYCGIFVILGAVVSGAGAAKTLGELGAVNAIAGAFVVALAAAVDRLLADRSRLSGFHDAGHRRRDHRLGSLCRRPDRFRRPRRRSS